MGLGVGVVGVEGAQNEMHHVIKTGCAHHRPAQLEEDRTAGQGTLSQLWLQSQAHQPGGCSSTSVGLFLGI